MNENQKNQADLDRLGVICQAIVDKKGTNVVVLDVRSISNFTEYFILAEGTVDRHILAIAKEVESTLEKRGDALCGKEGLEAGSSWIVLDYSEIVVHLFTHEARMKYALEEVWKDGLLVDVVIQYV